MRRARSLEQAESLAELKHRPEALRGAGRRLATGKQLANSWQPAMATHWVSQFQLNVTLTRRKRASR